MIQPKPPYDETLHQQNGDSELPIREKDLLDVLEYTDGSNPEILLAGAAHHCGNTLAVACSFSMEDTVIIDMLHHAGPSKTMVFALDTGRLPEEVYACADQLRERFDLTIHWYHPQLEAIEQLLTTKGAFSFRQSIENRKECCRIRKIEPLHRALSGMSAWVTGQRRQHGITREQLQVVETDQSHGGIVKLNPLALWTMARVRQYVLDRKLPYNSLYEHGYTSIGCAPCTRPVQEGEAERAGRWWWEQSEHRECGIHSGTRARR